MSVLKNDAKANGTEANQVRALLTDANNNPVENQTIGFTVTGNAKVSQTTKTDSSGYADANITNSTAQTVTVTAKYGTSSKTASVTFKDSRVMGFANGTELNLFELIGNTTQSECSLRYRGTWIKTPLTGGPHTVTLASSYDVPDSQGSVPSLCRQSPKKHVIYVRGSNQGERYKFINVSGALMRGNNTYVGGNLTMDPDYTVQCSRAGTGSADIYDPYNGETVTMNINCE